MNVSVILATHGDPEWEDLAWAHAHPSVIGQGALEVLVEHDPGGTLASVRNGTAFEASGDWLCFLDADDELAPDYLAAMREAICAFGDPTCPCPDGDECHYVGEDAMSPPSPSPSALLVPSVQYVYPDGREDPPSIPNGTPRRPLHDINRAVIGTLVPRELFLQVGGFPEEPIYEDWACWLACERAGAVLVDVPDAVYRAHVRPQSRNQQALHRRGLAYARIRRAHLAAVSQTNRRAS